MPSVNALPGLKQVVGALVFGANRPLKIKELRNCLIEVAESDPELAVYADVDDKLIKEALTELQTDLTNNHVGFTLHETASGYRIRSDAECGRWLRHLLRAKPTRLSQSSLETLAIIAYRQPISKADIESVRGVSVSHVIKPLMEMHLVRIAGRSELPGRPFLYGTTQTFLEHFGLKSLKELDKMAPTVLSRRELKSADEKRSRKSEKPEEAELQLNLETPEDTQGGE
jgi:segregation and condensation protein B